MLLTRYSMVISPYQQIKKKLSLQLPKKAVLMLPKKWEKIGDVLLIKLSDDLSPYHARIAKTYAAVLNCRSVLLDLQDIKGAYREPHTRLIYGATCTETIHVENGVKYRLDPQKIMFSSGNKDERIRMASIAEPHEVIVDLFAGIGYFTLPIAVHSKPDTIYACELNPVAYNFLCENLTLNHVTDIVRPILGDNRTTAPHDTADRVIMGYLFDTYRFLPTAFDVIKRKAGVLHFHGVFPEKNIPDGPFKQIRTTADRYQRKLQLLCWHAIKSYAPGVSHYVFDIWVDRV